MILLETERLIVKSNSLDNLEKVHGLYSDADVMRYIGCGAKTYEGSHNAVKVMIQHEEKHGFSSGDVYEKETGLFVGRAGLVYLEMKDDQPDIEIGYILHKQFWKKGYATELAKAIIEWGFKNLPISKLVATVFLENTESRQVLEKAGMNYVGNIRYSSNLHCHDHEVAKYEILKTKQHSSDE